MKNIILGILLLSIVSVKAQTNVIANKSHYGDLTDLKYESANFGLDERMLIDSVIYIGGDCIVEVRNAWGNFQSRDTICNNYYFKEHGYSHESAAKTYRSNTVIVGFKKSNKIIDNSKNWNRTNGVIWFVGLLLISSLIYIVQPLKKQN
jgi:hypothetical protein